MSLLSLWDAYYESSSASTNGTISMPASGDFVPFVSPSHSYPAPTPDHYHRRFLAPLPDDQKPTRSDYSILSVSVMTLGLIMAVELGRHRLDHAALGRPFFHAVLHGVYAELSTLGLVELAIWLLLTYYDDINIAKEKVFAKVHFTLFYTAIFNAFQTVIVAFFTRRISYQMWVRTETLELDHYVEIREEFDRVQEQLRQLRSRGRTKNNNPKDSTNNESDENDNNIDPSGESMVQTEFVFTWSRDGFAGLWQGLYDRIRYPRVKARYRALLVQVRFHELRINFLQTYQLPLQFKLSDYLIKSEQAVLIKLVHVSTAAWLVLTACINLLYFVMGIITWQTERPSLIGKSMILIFFVSMTVFVIVALVVFNKMKAIFRKIMHDETLWTSASQEHADLQQDLVVRQQSLFWGHKPSYVIAALQFMQFGYAIALAVVLIFWETIENGPVSMISFLMAIFGCYSVFVLVTAQTLPRYTMCTSLGQLVDQRRLNETLATYHLEKERERQLLQALEVDAFEKDGTIRDVSKRSGGSSAPRPQAIKSVLTKKKAEQQGEVLASLVKIDTLSLRQELPEVDRERLDMREHRRHQRRQRYKTMSDGVAAMALMRSNPVDRDRHSVDDINLTSSRVAGDHRSADSSGASGDNSSVRDQLQPKRRNRYVRRKSVSDGVAAMSWNQTSKRIDEEGEQEESFFDTGSRPPLEIFSSESGLASMGSVASVRENSAPSGKSVNLVGGALNRDIAGSFRARRPRSQSNSAASVSSGQGEQDFDSNVSEGGHSDVDDVPEIDAKTLERIALAWEHDQRNTSIHDLLHAFFLSQRQRAISHVFGTLVAFFFVGERVERFLHTDGVVGTGFVSFDFHQAVSFTFLALWFSMFILVDSTVLLIFKPWKRIENIQERKVVTAAVMDLILTIVCLVVLLVAESQRCCHPTTASDESNRLLAGDERNQAAPCSCPAFGSRTYGGLGNIEPYISLIALRFIRFWVSSKVIKCMARRGMFDKEVEDVEVVRITDSVDPFDVFDELGGHDEHNAPQIGTAVQLWESTIGANPDVVKKYGKFSSEVLKLMLDIPLPAERETEVIDSNHTAIEPLREYSIPDEYCNLSIQAQGIIAAGMVGKSVTPSETRTKEASVQFEDQHVLNPSRFATQHLTFQIDPSLSDMQDSTFVSPNSRLVRSMRRGDRMLLPILDKWGPVDVVLTRFEMVYFDASSIDQDSLDEGTEGVKQALVATKGGKGLRLSDVADGRRVVGHLKLADISAIHVERELPNGSEKDPPEESHDFVRTEFWNHVGEETGTLNERNWSKIKQDKVRIETVHGHKLFVRFYADYEDTIANSNRMLMERESDGPIFKNNAFQWVQTIGRYCGPDQLSQDLPHFGKDTADELRDFLIVSKPEKEKRFMPRPLPLRHHHRTSSTGDLPILQRPTALSERSVTHLGVTTATATHNNPIFASTRRPSRARRSVSAGNTALSRPRVQPNVVLGRQSDLPNPFAGSSAANPSPMESTDEKGEGMA